MKKLSTLLLALIITTGLFAQDEGGTSEMDNPKERSAFLEDDKIFQAGFSFLNYYWWAYSRTSVIPPLTASLEFGVHEYISVGPFAGYARWSYDRINETYNISHTALGARGSFHYVPILNEALDFGLDESKFDFYVTLNVGVRMESTSDPNDNLDNQALFHPNLGFKYLFNPTLGIYFESGRGVLGHYGTLGLSARF